MPTIKPSLWFDDDLEAAMAFWTALLPDSHVDSRLTWPDDHPERAGQLLAADFTLCGVQVSGINGGPDHAGFTETFSMVLTCADQEELDRYWDALTADGGEESRCGWCRDRFGLSWQVVPANLGELMATPSGVSALMGMGRIVIADFG